MTIRYTQAGTPGGEAHRINIRRRILKTALTFFWHTARRPTRRYIERRLFAPRRYRTSPIETRFLETSRSFTIMVNEKTVRCWLMGEGPAILFAHGWNGRGIQFHHFFKRLIESGFSAVFFDAPAHGDSGGTTTNGFEIAEAVRMLLDHPDGFSITGIIAHSLGGASAVMALTRLEKCPDAVLIAPPLKLREMLFESFDTFGIPRTIYTSLISEMEENLGYSLVADNPHLHVNDLPARFLIIHDRDDRTVPYTVSVEAAGKSPNISLHTTEGLGHKGVLSDPEVVERALEFVTKVKCNSGTFQRCDP